MNGIFVMKEKSGFSATIEETVARMTDIYNRIRVTKQIPVLEIRSDIMSVIGKMVRIGNFVEMLAALQGDNQYESRHAIAVSYISMTIGKWLDWDEPELNRLALAALLHDVGKVYVPPSLLEENELDADSFEVVKSHTLHGYRLIKETVGLSHRHALVALQHHERMDGSGYPMGIVGKLMDPMSVIVAVAEVFHSMASKQVYRNSLPFDQIISELRSYEFGKLDPVVIRVLLERLMQSLIGHKVILSDGKHGRVIMLGAYDILRPVVQIGSRYCDLGTAKDLRMVQVIIGNG